MWQHVKHLNGHSTENKIPDELILNGKSTANTHIILESLNYYLLTITGMLKSEHPQENPALDTIHLDKYITNKIPSALKAGIPLMKLTDLISTMKSLDVTKATGLDGLTPKILKTSAEIVAPTLL